MAAEAAGSVAEVVGLSSLEAEVGIDAFDELDDAVVLFLGTVVAVVVVPLVVVSEEVRNL